MTAVQRDQSSRRAAGETARSRAASTISGAARRRDFMGAGIARDDEPGPAAGGVVPVFLERPRRIVAQIDVFKKRALCSGVIRIWPPHAGIAEIGKLARVALTAAGAGNSHLRCSVQIGLRAGA